MRGADRLLEAIDRDRIARRALELVAIPSPTGQTRVVSEFFANVYRELGCDVQVMDDIPSAPKGTDAPAVAAYLRGGDGPTLQLDGHYDTVPVEHTPAGIVDGVLHGRGAADMKGGVAAIMEAVSAFVDAGIGLPGDLLLTGHGLHEAPTGHGEGLKALIAAGHIGEEAIVAEGPSRILAVAGRGMAIYNVTITGHEESNHENSTPPGTPHPLVAAGELLVALERERERLSTDERPGVGPETLFVGQVHGGDFYNRFPTACAMQGTRRYFADHSFDDVVAEFCAIASGVAEKTGTRIEVEFDRIRDGFELREDDRVVKAFSRAYERVDGGAPEHGGFPSVGDASILFGEGRIPALYAGYDGYGAHGDHESVSINELVRLAEILTLSIAAFYGIE
jgi:acetylornithine deacetylase/succinyl-diaminopimelate desuccinylase-like protein